MKTALLHRITPGTDNIVTATPANSNEVVMLLSSGEVCRYNINEQHCQTLFSVKSNGVVYADGGFDCNAKSTIYTLGDIVVVVNDYKQHGFIHYPGKYNHLHLWRGKYHADISQYPIALYKNNEGIPHIIFGCDWNHVQVMNLDTRQVLTADKSLIEENAEERHIEFYSKHEEHNKLMWPRKYDYFFGKLHLSPDNKLFLSTGWAWGSCDALKAYDVEHFINNNRIRDIRVFEGEHVDRAACWVDNNTIALTYNPRDEGDNGATSDSPGEIHFYEIQNGKAGFRNKIRVNGFNIAGAAIYHNKQSDAIIAISDKEGIAVISQKGEILYQDKSIQADSYDTQTNLLLKAENNTLVIHQIVLVDTI